ncbi:myosin heavy chain IB-like [Coturnix japonica]|uniref:myosin heavy chain IB-like n=1 Tax=Coturnix japonica TaxID=93934 RepID=UPI00077744D3|nr:myosin heavy chain IB-like [Coturnix japonica]
MVLHEELSDPPAAIADPKDVAAAIGKARSAVGGWAALPGRLRARVLRGGASELGAEPTAGWGRSYGGGRGVWRWGQEPSRKCPGAGRGDPTSGGGGGRGLERAPPPEAGPGAHPTNPGPGKWRHLVGSAHRPWPAHQLRKALLAAGLPGGSFLCCRGG